MTKKYQQKFDYIIAGAGAAGLTLLWYLSKSDVLREKQILLIDKHLAPTDSKTWCFWDDGSLPVSEFVEHTWRQLDIHAKGSRFSEKLKTYQYHCIRSYNYTSELLDLAAFRKNITMLEAGIQHFSDDGKQAVAHTDQGNFAADMIFQSALKPPGYDHANVDISLQQHFLGWDIECDTELFNPCRVLFMDFETSQRHGVSFFYILPFTKKKALIEYTLFTENLLPTEEYEKEIKNYLLDRYNLQPHEFKITRTEKGSIPMEDREYKPWYCKNVLNIGTAGGYTKPSTGYTFSRIHKHLKGIVYSLDRGEPVTGKRISPYRFRVYDMMLLYLLKNEPEISVTIFHDLFKNNKIDTLLAFLDETTRFHQELAIFSTVPYRPFFRSIYKMKHRLFTGV